MCETQIDIERGRERERKRERVREREKEEEKEQGKERERERENVYYMQRLETREQRNVFAFPQSAQHGMW